VHKVIDKWDKWEKVGLYWVAGSHYYTTIPVRARRVLLGKAPWVPSPDERGDERNDTILPWCSSPIS